MSFKVALAQLNPTVGDLSGNLELIRQAAQQAAVAGAELMVCSELVVSGYPPKDLLLRENFAAHCDHAVEQLARDLPPQLGVIVGHPTARQVPNGRVANAASLLSNGTISGSTQKLLLPNYDVFDERRYFRATDTVRPIEFRGRRLGVHICEDAWWGHPTTPYHDDSIRWPDPVAELARHGVDVFVNLSASPFEREKPHRRFNLVRHHVTKYARPFVFVNQVGGNDDLVFDGNSFVAAAHGERAVQLPGFESALHVVDLEALATSHASSTGASESTPHPTSELLDALILGLRDYCRKSRFTDCVLGLSGGIDSALACYIAAQAVGAEHVHGLAMPSRYSSQHSIDDARTLAESLGIDFAIVPIDSIHQAYEATDVVGADILSQPAGLADQNLQARIRGACVMTRSNRYGWLALATGNKSELAVGYCTLYGDMCGGFAVLSDLFKRDVYAISHYINDIRERCQVIPASSLEKAPSAELAPNQFDQDTLPPYPVLDAILEGLIEREESIATLSARFPEETVRWVAVRLDRNEFKRRQLPPGIKLSSRAFGSGRRMPIAARFE